jgi:hypothetical protein
VDHAHLYRQVAVSRIVRRLATEVGPTGDVSEWLHQVAASDGEWFSPDEWDRRLEAFEAAHPGHLPLTALPRADALVLVAAGLIEEDIRFGALFASLQEPLRSRRPCVGLLGWLLAGPDLAPSEVTAASQRLVHGGLLSVENPGDPRAEWVGRLPVAVWDLVGRGYLDPTSLPTGLELQPASGFPDLEAVVVPADLTERLSRVASMVADGRVPTVVIRGPRSSGRRTLAGAIARRVGRDLLVHRGAVGDEGWRLLAPLATLAGAMAVTVVDPGPGETIELPAPTPPGGDRIRTPLAVLAGRHGGLSGSALDGALSIALGGAGPDERARLWAETGLIAHPAELAVIAERFALTAGNIHRAAPIAAAVAGAAGRREVVAADVREATAALSRQALETLATPLPPLETTAQPVLAPVAAEELHTLIALCRHRERLGRQTGAALQGSVGRGVRALFSGPSGTGKTLAARYLAARLGLDLYRVDLAAVVSKYIGETERNLDQVLSRAEELDVVLLLDEGDGLMTRRTEVGNANDRYANLETNFLLQRLETFEGIAVITSNAASRIDTAFQRRIDVTVELGPPDPDARRQIWWNHLPPDQRVSAPLLDEVARRCSLTGGRIRNAALHASLLSLENGRPVGDEELMAALRREYRRMGATFPLAHQPPP